MGTPSDFVERMIGVEIIDDRPIGQGAFSNVYRGTWESEPIAVKRLKRREDGQYSREAVILSKVKHENIVRFFTIRENHLGTYDIVLELGCGVTLAGALYRGSLTDSWKQSTIYQISNGLAYLHRLGIIHLDLKPPNILFKNYDLGRVLITDFGMATTAVESHRAGAQKFRAPDFPFRRESDVFSLAAIACCILHGTNPTTEEETEDIVSKVLTHQHLHQNILDVLERGVNPKYFCRPTASEFRDAFDMLPLTPCSVVDGREKTVESVRTVADANSHSSQRDEAEKKESESDENRLNQHLHGNLHPREDRSIDMLESPDVAIESHIHQAHSNASVLEPFETDHETEHFKAGRGRNFWMKVGMFVPLIIVYLIIIFLFW